MATALKAIRDELEEVVDVLNTEIKSDQTFSAAHGSWNIASISKFDLISNAQSIIDAIDERGEELSDTEHEKKLGEYVSRLQFLQSATIPSLWNAPNQGVPAFDATLDGLRRALVPFLNRDTKGETAIALRKVTRQVRGLEARANDLETRAKPIATMIEAIESAFDAADQLPTDLESLREAKNQMGALLAESQRNQGQLLKINEDCADLSERLRAAKVEAEQIVKNCESAYAAATSVGLAAAFGERSKALSFSMWVWVVGLVTALAVGSVFGGSRLGSLVEILKDPNTQVALIVPNIMLALVSVGAPLWFAWLSTKQIGQRFRLSEDYAFKAAVSRAYEGYRREAAHIDKDMEAKLLSSALTRLDELPLRLVEPETHGSPWNELLSSQVVKDAMRAVPEFAQQVRDLATKTLTHAKSERTEANTMKGGDLPVVRQSAE